MKAEATHLLADHVLVAGAQAGDPEALDTLISAVRSLVVSYCRSRLATYAGGLDAAEDVAQETCLAVVRVLPAYQRQAAPFTAFVYAIAANKVADAQRRFGRSAVLLDELPDQVEPSLNPEDRLIAATAVRVAHQLLAQLPPRMREVLLLRAGGASADTIGQQLGMTANAVRVAQHRAGVKLRAMIEDSAEYRDFFAPLIEADRNRPAA